ncbi:MAG: TetR/AcrR family transcriptional regulator [Candidatus Binatia bacterium]
MARGDRSPETRDALLGAGARVFLRRGLYGATVREIVGEAGLTAPALYYHFEGKEDLYGQLIRGASERFRSYVEAALATESEPVGGLAAIARACIHFAEEDRTRLRVFYSELFRPGAPDELGLGLRELRVWAQGRVEDLLRRLVGRKNGPPDFATASRLFIAMLSGLLAEQARQPEEALLDEALAGEVVRVFLWGVGRVKE